MQSNTGRSRATIVAFFQTPWAKTTWLITFALVPFGETLVGLLLLIVGWLGFSIYARRPLLLESDRRAAYLVLAGMAAAALFSFRPGVSWSILLAQALALILFFQGGWWLANGDGRSGYPDVWEGRAFPVLCVASTVSWLYAIVSYLVATPVSDRAQTLLGGFMGLGTLLVAVGILVFGYLDERRSTWRWPYLLLTMVAMALTYSRGAWLAMGAALLLYGARTTTGRRFLVQAIPMVVVLALIFAFVPGVPEFVVQRFATGDNGRFGIWSTVVHMIAAHPWLGVGPGVHPMVYGEYLVPGAMPGAGHAHNIILGYVADLGLLGGAAFFLFIGLVTRRAWSLLSVDAPLTRALGASFLGFLLHQMTDLTMYGADIGGIFWIWTGLVWGTYERTMGSQNEK